MAQAEANEQSSDEETLAAFVRREGAYPEPPADRTRYQWIDAGLRARREIDGIRQLTTHEEAATGPALAEWIVKLLDLWVAAGALPPDQLTAIRLRFLDPQPCPGSGRIAGRGLLKAACPACPVPRRYDNEERFYEYRVDPSGRVVAHDRDLTVEEVAKAMHRSTAAVRDLIKAAMATIAARIWPPDVAAPEVVDG